MDMHALRYFLDVWKTGSITTAATNNYITQSALSKRIALLETELGVQLFQRGKGRQQIAITANGQAFVDIAERMLLLYQQAVDLHSDAERQSITIGCINSVLDYILPPMVFQLEQQYPHFCITLENHHSVEIFTLVENSRVDVGITQSPAPFPDLASELLYEEDYRVVIRKNSHSFQPGEILAPEMLPVEKEIFQWFDGAFSDWHDQWWLSSRARIRVGATSTAEHYFQEPMNWMLVPAAVAHAMEARGFQIFQIRPQPPQHYVYLVYRKRAQEEYIHIFAEQAKTYFAAFSPLGAVTAQNKQL